MILKKIIYLVFFAGLIYILLPGAYSIDNFPSLPGSVKSQLEGDTIQNPNIAAYFSDFRRDFITKYYKEHFSKTLLPFISLPVITLNHPPEAAYRYVRDQQESTFLEEYIFPLREQIYVNGYEPKVENDMYNKQYRSLIGDKIGYEDKYFNSKTTLRFYPSNIFVRTFVYITIWVLSIFLFRLYVKTFKE